MFVLPSDNYLRETGDHYDQHNDFDHRHYHYEGNQSHNKYYDSVHHFMKDVYGDHAGVNGSCTMYSKNRNLCSGYFPDYIIPEDYSYVQFSKENKHNPYYLYKKR